jgi:hypothetical protein
MVRGLPSRKNLLLAVIYLQIYFAGVSFSLIYNMDDYHAENMNFVG